jgi:hypothetical protein
LSYSQQNDGFAVTEAFDQTTHSDNVVISNSEAYSCPVGFRVAGANAYDHPTVASRLNNASLANDYAHDCANGFLASWASDLTMTNCTTASVAGASLEIGGVQTAHLHSCPTAYIIGPRDRAPYTHWGSSSAIAQD